MTNSKYLYSLLVLSLALTLFTGLRRILQSNTIEPNILQSSVDANGGANDAVALSSNGSIGVATSSLTPTAAMTVASEAGGQPRINLSATQPAEQAGGIFVQVVERDADTLNPLLTTNPTSLAVLRKIYPALLDQDPASGLTIAGGGLAADWQFASDGRAITFTLHSGVMWSDGAPVTARDVKFTYDAIRDPAIANPYRDNFANVNDIQLVPGDDQRVVLQLATADCAILQALYQPILPSHLYGSATAAELTDPALWPQISAGPFALLEWTPNSRITLVRNPTYWAGAPNLERWEFHVMPDPLVRLQALLDGKADWLELAPAQIAQAQANADLTIYQTLADRLTFVALNQADPQAPQTGRTALDELAPQAAHPILGDQRVRQALAQAIDYTQVLNDVYGNRGRQLGTYVLPTISWAHAAELAPTPFDRAAAQQLLAAAGWVDSDGDGVRERDGVRLALSLITNTDSSERVQLGPLLVAQWQAIGVAVTFQALPFDTVTNQLLAQTYDMVLIGWDNLGADPINSDFWHSRYDTPGSGTNFVSYQNAQVDAWLDQARTAPACDPTLRGTLYRAVQEQIAQDLPYILLSGQMKAWAYPTEWQELRPAPWRFDSNVQAWWKSDR